MEELQREMESEIKEEEAQLRVLQKDKPRPWYYHCLPDELRVEIFKWITHPGDQVNLRRAFPGGADLMKWDPVDLLYFKRIYPLVQDYLWENWHDIWRLCQVSPEFMDVVLHHFKNSLSDRTVVRRHPQITYDFFKGHPRKAMNDIEELVDECDALGRTEWMNNMPFLVVFDFHISLDEPIPLVFLAEFLDAHGEQIWACEITMGGVEGGAGSPDEFVKRLLKWTPNVVHLQLCFYKPEHGVLRAADSFPYLPQLRSLSCMNLVSTEPFIQKHAAQLTSLAVLRILDYSPIIQNMTGFQNLIYYDAEVGTLPVRNIIPDSFLQSPLHTLSMCLSEDNQVIPELTPVLYHLSHFGDTLENLALLFNFWISGNWVVTGDQWMGRVRLPKVRRLRLKEYQGKLDWLVALPSLHTLVLRDYNRNAKADLGERSPDLIYVSTHRITRFQTNVWTRLPNLRQLKIEHDCGVFKSSFCVTRRQHEAYQNGSWFQKMALTILAVFQEICGVRITDVGFCCIMLMFSLLYLYLWLLRYCFRLLDFDDTTPQVELARYRGFGPGPVGAGPDWW